MKKQITLLIALTFFGAAQAQLPHLSQLKDINVSGGSDAGTRYFTECNGKLYFTADDGIHGGELWVTDSTEAGTHMVKDINPGATGSFPIYIVALNNKIYFNCYDGTHGTELWVSDGTSAGTTLLKDIKVGYNDSYPASLTVMNNKIYFQADDSIHAIEPWVTDGTAAGTILLADINQNMSYQNSFPDYFTAYNNKIYFQADDYDHGLELWSTDGTPAGTMMVKDINTLASGFGSDPAEFKVFNGKLYFKADTGNGTHEGQLWVTDGTNAGTVLVKDIYPTDNASVAHLHVFNNSLYFTAKDGINGYELWKSDGTTAGTALFKDINPGSSGSYGDLFTTFKDKFYFQADNGTDGYELWASDGTAAGTVLFKNINSASGDGWPAYFTPFGSHMYFSAQGGSTYAHSELWRTDGTVAGTLPVLPPMGNDDALGCNNGFYPFGPSLYFDADYSMYNCEVWKMDTLTGVQGLNEYASITDIVTVYPNPSNGLFQLKIADFNGIQVEVYNTFGQKVYTASNLNTSTAIDLSKCSNGIYNLRVFKNEALISQSKLVKND